MDETVESAYLGGELDLFALATNWKAYVKAEIGEFLNGIVLEVGAGIGGTTAALHDGAARRWVCLEPDPQQASRLRASLIHHNDTRAASVVVGSLRTFAERPLFDSILYMDVLEHIEDDQMQIEMAAKLIRPGGYIVILSPAHQWLFSAFDERIGHLRRYNKQSLRSLRPPDWFERKLVYLDSVGVLLSLGNVWLLRRTLPSRSQITLWDRLCVPMSRFADPILRGNFGKSVLAVWQKGASA